MTLFDVFASRRHPSLVIKAAHAIHDATIAVTWDKYMNT